jgi:hypothetical protein
MASTTLLQAQNGRPESGDPKGTYRDAENVAPQALVGHGLAVRRIGVPWIAELCGHICIVHGFQTIVDGGAVRLWDEARDWPTRSGWGRLLRYQVSPGHTARIHASVGTVQETALKGPYGGARSSTTNTFWKADAEAARDQLLLDKEHIARSVLAALTHRCRQLNRHALSPRI